MMQCVVTVLVVLCGLVIFSDAKENQCPGGKASCPDDSTCCVLSNDSFGCCPIQNAVCCGDSVHCCPPGYTCDVMKGFCKMGRKLVPLLKKIPAYPIMVNAEKRADHLNMIGKIQAIKTSKAGECFKGFKTKPMLQKISALKTKTLPKIKSPYNKFCPDMRSECGSAETCCKKGRGYSCCPIPRGVCCRSGRNCCRPGEICDYTEMCIFRRQRVTMYQKVSATKKRAFGRPSNGPARPDKNYQCPKESTRCKLPSGTYGCCTLKNAVSCTDHKYSCPEGYKYDVEAVSDAELNNTRCLDEKTHCELADGHNGCCPSSKEVCCSDHEHCCPAGFRCDLTAHMCVAGNVHLPMLKNAYSPSEPKAKQVNLDEKIHFVPASPRDEDLVTDED